MRPRRLPPRRPPRRTKSRFRSRVRLCRAGRLPSRAALTATTQRLRDALGRWDPAGAVPRDVTYLALHHQRILRLMADRRRLGNATLVRLPADVLGEARDTVAGAAASGSDPALARPPAARARGRRRARRRPAQPL